LIAATDLLPLTSTVEPSSVDELVDVLAESAQRQTLVYPIGGGTSLNYGLKPTQAGLGVTTSGLSRVIDYPARDMTITVESGITLAQLAATMLPERQWLPIDAPQPDQATLGGVIATAFNGPRRFGWGTIRDYVIGIAAVDGRGKLFHGGGRVVKNVAGYDFCKLLTGSAGTLGVIAQVTLKVKPIPAVSRLAVAAVRTPQEAEQLITVLLDSAVTPAAIEWIGGPRWDGEEALAEVSAGGAGRLLIGLEGTEREVAWMEQQLHSQWSAAAVPAFKTLSDVRSQMVWDQLRNFPATAGGSVVLKLSVLPSQVTNLIERLRKAHGDISFQSHAGNGIVIASFPQFRSQDVTELLFRQLHPLVVNTGGSVVVLSSTGLAERTRQVVWGPPSADAAAMRAVKQQFDPHHLLNRGRFVFS
jgi:glycolate oxidase FAD binding subunit